MSIRDDIQDQFAGTELIFYDGFDDCIVGVTVRFGMEPSVCYDYHACILSLARRGRESADDELDLDAAEEFFDFNVIGGWVGDHTPTFLVAVEEDIM